MGAVDMPLVLLDLMVGDGVSTAPPTAFQIATLADSLVARGCRAAGGAKPDLGGDHQLVAMMCYMFKAHHYVVFCRRLSDKGWRFFNDIPGTATQAKHELGEWRLVCDM